MSSALRLRYVRRPRLKISVDNPRLATVLGAMPVYRVSPMEPSTVDGAPPKQRRIDSDAARFGRVPSQLLGVVSSLFILVDLFFCWLI